MNADLFIAASAVLSGRRLSANGVPVYADDHAMDFDAFAKAVYKQMNLSYLKFFKMDHLCKQGFLTAEAMMRNLDPAHLPSPDRVGVGICGAWSSLDTDQRFYTSYEETEERIPSPGLFVYTLPNILIGELCIRHRFTGEHASFVLEPTQLESLYLYAGNLFETGLAEACLVGWNDYYGDMNHCAMAWIVRASEDARYQAFTADWHTEVCRMNDVPAAAIDALRIKQSKN